MGNLTTCVISSLSNTVHTTGFRPNGVFTSYFSNIQHINLRQKVLEHLCDVTYLPKYPSKFESTRVPLGHSLKFYQAIHTQQKCC